MNSFPGKARELRVWLIAGGDNDGWANAKNSSGKGDLIVVHSWSILGPHPIYRSLGHGQVERARKLGPDEITLLNRAGVRVETGA